MESREHKVKMLKDVSGRMNNMRSTEHFYIGEDIPSKKVNTALKSWAPGIDRTMIIGLLDTSLFQTAKCGYLFTEDKLVWKTALEKPVKFWYEDITDVTVYNQYDKVEDQILHVDLSDGSSADIQDIDMDKLALKEFLEEMMNYISSQKKAPSNNNIDSSSFSTNFGAKAGGIAAANYNQVNKSYDEEKFHARQGHGFAAERANNLYDNLIGHDAEILGDDNAKNGIDRIADGIEIQSKYCKSAKDSVNACFDNDGNFRYYTADGKPMKIEVPSDQYEAAISAMEDRIKNGEIKGINDPNEAKNIIRKGHFTYTQARNIAKAGTVESITYDAINGSVIALSTFGLTTVLTFAVSTWNGDDWDLALEKATVSGLKVGGTAFVVTVLGGQLSKAGLNSMLVGSSEKIVSVLGPKASAVLINAFRDGSNIYGAAAMKSAAKLLRGNAITQGLTIVILSAVDVTDIFRGRISGKQLAKNVTNTTATVAGGGTGWMIGSAIGSAIPGPGTVVGGLVGSVIGGAITGKASSKALNQFVEDDADEMVRIIQKVFADMCSEYLLSRKEAEKCADRLRDKLTGGVLKDMYASNNRKKFARNLLKPIVEGVTNNRVHIRKLTDEDMICGLRKTLENIADANLEMA